MPVGNSEYQRIDDKSTDQISYNILSLFALWLKNCLIVLTSINKEVCNMLKELSHIESRVCIRAGVCRPCVETKLTATEKSATDQSQL